MVVFDKKSKPVRDVKIYKLKLKLKKINSIIYIWIETIKQTSTKLTGPAPSAPKSTAKSTARSAAPVSSDPSLKCKIEDGPD
ncbi:hypothetical protein BpHYR1_010373 [Brachionus plicatilis]|uniref:Uncharacterized protein n=1 Tax=Brachionus plicatilis TaxID=10195 RepID=A0A3M7Q8D1_BRAPC|nr:hypothetical protein BpHYR1_010373 [Brachionus plicatilis]